MPDEPLLVGVDIGTSSSKAVVTNRTGKVLRSARRQHGVSTPVPGHVEQDAERIWWDETADLLGEVVAGDAALVAAVAVSGLGPCVLPTDEAGHPRRAAILYGVDTRATTEIAELEAELGADAIVERCGSVLSTQAAGPKLRWLAKHEPEVLAGARRVFTASSFVVHRLTGAYVLDHHTASQYDPLYDLRAGAWIDEWWDHCAPTLQPPRLAWPAEIVGTVHGEAAARTGLAVGTPVTAGTVDAWAEAVSVGVRQPGDVMLMYGTTMFLVAVTPVPVRHPALWTTTGVDPGSSCVAGGMATSGALTTWWADLVGSDVGGLFAAATDVPPGARGLLALPYFAGERTPIADPAARGVLAGLTLAHGPAEVFRALLEASAFGVRHNLAAYADAGIPVRRLVAVGGGTTDPLWPAIVSDVCGIEQVVPEVTIGAAYGDARLAAEAVCLADDPWGSEVGFVHPDPALGARYDRGYQRYRDLYTSTRDLVHDLGRDG